MRVPSELWVKALLRRCGAAAVPAVVVRRGDDDAGAIFLKVAMLDGRAKLFGPEPAGFAGNITGMPKFMAVLDPAGAPEPDVDAYLARQLDFDSDLWIVEIEDRAGRSFLDQ